MGQPRRIDNPWPTAEVLVLERTGSTMDDCLALGKRGCPSGTTVVAGFQERGRGRAPGRRWESPAWESLLMTVLLHRGDGGQPAPPLPPSRLPLLAGLAVSRAVFDRTGASPSIRWPNDVLLGGRKLAGILCEAQGRLLLVGIGVNCLQRSFPADLAQTAGSLLGETGRSIHPLDLCAPVLVRLREALVDGAWREAIESRLYRRGETVCVQPIGRGQRIDGIVLGIDGDGRLLLRRGRGIVRVGQGEISEGR